MERISRKLNSLLPGKDKFLQQIHDTVADAFLDQVITKLLNPFLYNNAIVSLAKDIKKSTFWIEYKENGFVPEFSIPND